MSSSVSKCCFKAAPHISRNRGFPGLPFSEKPGDGEKCQMPMPGIIGSAAHPLPAGHVPRESWHTDDKSDALEPLLTWDSSAPSLPSALPPFSTKLAFVHHQQPARNGERERHRESIVDLAFQSMLFGFQACKEFALGSGLSGSVVSLFPCYLTNFQPTVHRLVLSIS